MKGTIELAKISAKLAAQERWRRDKASPSKSALALADIRQESRWARFLAWLRSW